MVRRYVKAPTQRQLRVAENLKEAISEIFVRNELSLLILEKIFITISEVRISPDLKQATVFIATITQIDEKELVKFLNENISSLKLALSKKIQLRFMPEISFVYDESFDKGSKIDILLNKAKT